MCPDAETLSTYYDDEIESKYSGIIEKHIENCSECRKSMSMFEGFSSALKEDIDIDIASSQERVWNKIMNTIDNEEASPDFWHKKISLSLPAAAALAAMFLAVFSLSILGYFVGKNSSGTGSELNITDASAYGQNFESIFDDSVIDLDIPSSEFFVSAGEPLLIKEVDFKGKRR